ncbi:MAG: peptidylprolyl isomerase [Janthinobacterium lividum]
MNKLATMFLSASLLSSAALADDNTILATYKGGEVKESQVMQQFKPVLDMNATSKDKKFSELDSNLQETLVTAYVRFKLLDQEAKDQGIEKLPDFQDKLNKAKSQLLEQEVIERYIKNNVNDKMIDDEYTKLAASLKGQEEIKVSHILLTSEEKAKEVKKELSKGGKFAALAKKYSSDEGSKSSGGELGFVIKGQLVPEFESKAFSMKVNDISDPVKTQFGWHIIKVLEKRPVKVPTKEEAKNSIAGKLNNDVVQKYFSDLMTKSDVKITMPKKEEKEIHDDKTLDKNKNPVAKDDKTSNEDKNKASLQAAPAA